MSKNTLRTGFSILELLVVVTILGIIAAVVAPREGATTSAAVQDLHAHNKSIINSAVKRYYVDTGAWPTNDLSDIGANPNYFPEGLPENPVNPTASYTIDATTHKVNTR